MAPNKKAEPTFELVSQEEEPSNLPARTGYLGDAGVGFEDTTAADYSLPFLGILQKMSPQVDPDQDVHIPGAKAGMIINSVTLDLYDGDSGIVFVPVFREHKYVEWVPREAGGGLVGVHLPESDVVLKAKSEVRSQFDKLTVNGNQLAETFYVYGIRLDADGNTDQAVVPFASTQIRAYKAWWTKARGIKLRNPDNNQLFPLPVFAHRYRMTTVLQENKKGKWHGWRINFDGTNATEARISDTDPLYEEAKALRSLVKEGVARINIAQSRETVDLPDDGDRF